MIITFPVKQQFYGGLPHFQTHSEKSFRVGCRSQRLLTSCIPSYPSLDWPGGKPEPEPIFHHFADGFLMVFLWFPKDEWLTPAIARGEVMFHSSRCGHCQWLDFRVSALGVGWWRVNVQGKTMATICWLWPFWNFFWIERLEEHRFLHSVTSKNVVLRQLLFEEKLLR